MEWTDSGVILAARRHGESSVILEVLTESHGRHLGLVRGGSSKRMRGALQPGNEIDLQWRARLSEHLGNFSIELSRARAAGVIDDPARLAALSAACAMASVTLPEREPHPRLHAGFRVLLDAIEGSQHWPALFVRWELEVLQELGFGLDLTQCAATGGSDSLVYVSPRTGRAVSAAAGEPYAARLLRLPGYLVGRRDQPLAQDDIEAGFALTGHFIERHLLAPHGRTMPAARHRLLDRLGARTSK